MARFDFLFYRISPCSCFSSLCIYMHAIIRMYDYAKHDFPFLHFYPVIKWRRLWRALSIDLLRETENERGMMEEEEEQDKLG